MTDGFVLDTLSQIDRFRIVVIKNAIKLYKNTGMKANRAYTPTNMRRAAEQITGKTFKARDWEGMIAALQEKLDEDSPPNNG